MFRRKKKKRGFFGRRVESSDNRPFHRTRRLFRMLVWLGVIAAIGGIALTYHFHRLDRMIAEKFDRPRKWDLPSRVYSDAEYLYPGTDIAARAIIAKLDRLGYRNTGDAISGPGDYAASQDKLEIYLHDFDYPGENFKGFPVRLALEGGVVSSITRTDENDSLDLVRLEPEEVASIFGVNMEDRTVVALDDVPKKLIEAIILVEDERFFDHSGVDPMGIVRAMFVNVAAMRIVQGGSTLTQQLVKNFFLNPKKSFVRKFNEMLIAHRIEKTHTKAEILEAYLNEIYLGQRGASSVSGVEEASRLYFAKDVSQLTLGECALTAGMIKNPSEYNPISRPERARARRDFVLKIMLEEELITKDEYDAAVAEKIITPKPKVKIATAPYFIDFLKRQLGDLYPQDVLQSEGLRIFTTLDMRSQLAAEKIVADGLVELEKNAANLLPKDHEEPLQACLVSIQPSTGYVRALVGGRDYGSSQFDRCTMASRQPGSTFKPFVYLTAVDPGRSKRFFTPASTIEDKSFEIESGGKMWSPANYDKKGHGIVTLTTALEESYNIATARIAIESGLENVVATARDAGIESPLDPVPAMALGAFEVLPIEMASAYTIFPNGGIRAEPISIINVANKDGEVLEKKRLQMRRTFDAAPVFIATTMMKGVLDRGTGASARSMGFQAIAAGKTGTTSNYRDAWFVGFTPGLLALVWVGFDDNAEIKMSGARAALPMWTGFMKETDPKGDGDFASPSGVTLVKIDPRTGGLTNSACPNGVNEAFIEGTEPKQTCDRLETHQTSPASKLVETISAKFRGKPQKDAKELKKVPPKKPKKQKPREF